MQQGSRCNKMGPTGKNRIEEQLAEQLEYLKGPNKQWSLGEPNRAKLELVDAVIQPPERRRCKDRR